MFALIVGGWLGLSIVVGVCAVKKNLKGFDYFLLSLLLSPIVGFVVVAVKKTEPLGSKPMQPEGDCERRNQPSAERSILAGSSDKRTNGSS